MNEAEKMTYVVRRLKDTLKVRSIAMTLAFRGDGNSELYKALRDGDDRKIAGILTRLQNANADALFMSRTKFELGIPAEQDRVDEISELQSEANMLTEALQIIEDHLVVEPGIFPMPLYVCMRTERIMDALKADTFGDIMRILTGSTLPVW